MWDVEAKPLNPQDAIDWFRSRLPLTDPQFRAISDEARRRAFFVSGLATLDMVQETMDALDSALAKGETFDSFKGRLTERITKAWGSDSPYRLRTIFDTNIQSAYGAGRYRAANDLAQERPFWGLEIVLDGVTSKTCRALVGLVMPANDPRWQGRIPPLHFRCRTALVTFSATQARGVFPVDKEPPARGLDGFGQIPGEREYTPSQADYHPELWSAYKRLQQPDLGLTPDRPESAGVNTKPVTTPAAEESVPPRDPISQRFFSRPRPLTIPQGDLSDLEDFLAQYSSEIEDVLGNPLTSADVLDLSSLTNAGEVRRVTAKSTGRGIEIELDGRLPDERYAVSRVLMIYDGDPHIYNDRFLPMDDDDERPPTERGFGARILAHQAIAAQRLGFERLHTMAARSDRPYSMNGYITWPKLGYDGRLASNHRADVVRWLSAKGEKLPGWVTTFQELMSEPLWAEAWAVVGDSVELDFDLEEGSPSMTRLRSYLKRNGYAVADGW